jgi:mRNA-degrading endonuclease YafQ of YafQ-DinJ toxin-antitoxin module
MKISSIYYSTSFKKSVKKYISHKNKIKKSILHFQDNSFDPSLKTHKLTGKLENYWSFSVDYHLRILFEFIDEETAGFINIGTHEIYK